MLKLTALKQGTTRARLLFSTALGCSVAIKSISKLKFASAEDRASMVTEVDLMHRVVGHPNVVAILDSFEDKGAWLAVPLPTQHRRVTRASMQAHSLAYASCCCAYLSLRSLCSQLLDCV
ncbi:hypothetical protein EON66_04125 [archaeon]|nr:MAG: hypothetical protein EON66_04125 [archaeon]